MHSQILQKQFPQIYEKFFLENDLVLSGCYSLRWGNAGVGNSLEYFHIRTKISLKCFVGINIIKTPEIRFKNLINYNISLNNFENIKISDVTKEEKNIILQISKFLLQNNFKKGIEINILSETSRGHNFSFSGTFTAILVVGLYIISSILDISLINNYEKFQQNHLFRNIFNFAKLLESIMIYFPSAGDKTATTLSNKFGPLVYISSKEGNDNEYVFFDLFEKFKEEMLIDELPIDYAIIFSGTKTNTKIVQINRQIDQQKIIQTKKFIQKIFDQDLNKINNYSCQRYLQDNIIYDYYMQVNYILSILTVKFFYEMLKNGYNKNYINDFIYHINNLRYNANIIEKEYEFTQDFISLSKMINKDYDEKIGITPIYTSFGGSYLCIFSKSYQKKIFQEIIDNLVDHYQGLKVEYTSREDGTISDGIIVEQYKSKGIYGKYISSDKCIYQDSLGICDVGEYSDLIQKYKGDILLDQITGKISLNGEIITSKDLLSQSATIDILDILIINIGEDVASHKLPYSTYTKMRTQMAGKIILPLKKLIKNRLNKNINLNLSGSIGEFVVRLEKSDVKIGIIKKFN